MKSPHRTGFSLMEVLVATALLTLSAIVLGELAAIGRLHAEGAEKLADAQWLAQAKLNEILCGATPAEPIDRQPLPERPGWLYSVRIDPVSQPSSQGGLTRGEGISARVVAVQVTVEENLESDLDAKSLGRRGKQFTLTHWLNDPALASRAQTGFESSFWADETPGEGAFTEEDILEEDALEEFFDGGPP